MTDPGTAHDGPETAPDGRSGSPEGETTNIRYERLCAALDAGWSGERARLVADRLTGSTRDEVQADAQRLAAQFPPDGGIADRSRATDPSQGRGNGGNVSTREKQTETLGEMVKRLGGSRGHGGVASV